MARAAYDLDEVLEACREAEQRANDKEAVATWPVRMWPVAVNDARLFGLLGQAEVFAYLAETPATQFVPANLNELLREHQYGDGVEVRVDSYTVMCRKKCAYLAFFKCPESLSWRIKSFKPNATLSREAITRGKEPLKQNPFSVLLKRNKE